MSRFLTGNSRRPGRHLPPPPVDESLQREHDMSFSPARPRLLRPSPTGKPKCCLSRGGLMFSNFFPHPHADSGCLLPTRPVCASSRRVSATPPYLGTPNRPPAISFQRTRFVPLPRGSLAPPLYRGTPTNTLADSKTYCISTDRDLCYDSLHWHACFTSRRLLSAHPVGASLKRLHAPHSYHGTPTLPPVVSY